MSFQEKYPRPYYSKYEQVELDCHSDWFRVYRLPGKVFAITEPKHCQEVNSFLIIGSQRALLWDTGEGFFDITEVARKLYSGEIIAANSHSHFDHIGCNHRFDHVLAYDDPQAHYTAERGAPHGLFADQLSPEMFIGGYPEGLDPETFFVPPYRIRTVRDGQLIDLGERILEVIHTPGHSPDSMMLLDRTNGSLFTGDTFYQAALYAHFDCPEFGRSDLNAYLNSMERIQSRIQEVKALYCSHNELIAAPFKVKEAADAFRSILNGKVMEGLTVDLRHVYLEDGTAIVEYPFREFSIVCRASPASGGVDYE